MLIYRRNALMSGKRLPYDAEVEYLESTGTQYILLPANNYDGVDIMLEPASGSTYGNIGRRTGTRADSICFDTTMGWAFRAYSSLTKTNDTNRSLRHATVHGTTATLDGVSYTLANGWNTVAFANKPFALFGLFNPSTQVMFAYVSCKIGACALYVGSEKVYDFISVRKGTVGYLYDRVSGKLFGNAGTGDFVLGQDVVPVEYIESHGTEYIDTGFKASNSTRVAADFESTNSTVNRWILGARNGAATATDKFALFYGNSSYAMIGSAMGEFSGATIKTGRHLLDMSLAGGVVVDSQIVATYSASEQAEVFSAAYAMVLFNLWNGSLNSPFIGRYYACKFWDNGNPVRKFLPVRVGTDATSWEGAMMDVLTRRIYRNAGTGAFGYGNDLKYPIPAS